MHRHITEKRRPGSNLLAITASQFGSQAPRGLNIPRVAVSATSANRQQRGLRSVRAPAAAGQRPQTRSCPPGAATGWAHRPRLQPARPAPPRQRRLPRRGCHPQLCLGCRPQLRWGCRPRLRWGCRLRTCWGCHPPAGARSGGCWPSSPAASAGAAAHRTTPLLRQGQVDALNPKPYPTLPYPISWRIVSATGGGSSERACRPPAAGFAIRRLLAPAAPAGAAALHAPPCG